jgi:hypothetical protein
MNNAYSLQNLLIIATQHRTGNKKPQAVAYGSRGYTVKPHQNGYAERYNRTARYERLNQYLFVSMKEIQTFATTWLWSYTYERPNMGIGGIPPT